MLTKCLDCQKDFNQGQEYWAAYCSVQKNTYNYFRLVDNTIGLKEKS